MKKKLFLGFGALGVAVLLSPLFAAFEAHVINVTATIENALGVSTDAIDFGTVFPQEHLARPLVVSLSESFQGTDRVDDVDYFIRQKPKCAVTNDDGTVLIGPTWTGHVVPGTGSDFTIDCDTDAPENLDEILAANPGAVVADPLPSLCEYISKDGEEETDGDTPSFHNPFTVENGVLSWLDTPGRLAKSESDLEDNWVIDLAVPCFGGNCAQDWADFVDGINLDADPLEFIQDAENKDKVFGCNLWIEVSGVSETPTTTPPELPTVGAALGDYLGGESNCNVFVNAGETIQSGVDAATAGQTVCVADGTYNETVVVNKSITLRSIGSSASAIINGGVIVDAPDATVSGFTVIPGNTEGELSSFYLKEAADNVTISFNNIDGTGVAGTPRGVVNVIGTDLPGVLISNNHIHDFVGGTGVYINPHTGMWTIELNDIDNNLAGIGQWNGANVLNNEFEHSIAGSEAIGVDNAWDLNGGVANFNNFLNGTKLNTYTIIAGTIDAEDNFFNLGGATQVDQTGGIVDFTPESVAQFPHN